MNMQQTREHFPIGTRVTNTRSEDEGKLDGTVVGVADLEGLAYLSNNGCYPQVLVQLDKGFYSEGRTSYVNVLSVHPDGIKPVS